jgi:hypothetical protein
MIRPISFSNSMFGLVVFLLPILEQFKNDEKKAPNFYPFFSKSEQIINFGFLNFLRNINHERSPSKQNFQKKHDFDISFPSFLRMKLCVNFFAIHQNFHLSFQEFFLQNFRMTLGNCFGG